MTKVLVRCPQTSELVPIGLDAEDTTLDIEGWTFVCEQCGNSHTVGNKEIRAALPSQPIRLNQNHRSWWKP